MKPERSALRAHTSCPAFYQHANCKGALHYDVSTRLTVGRHRMRCLRTTSKRYMKTYAHTRDVRQAYAQRLARVALCANSITA